MPHIDADWARANGIPVDDDTDASSGTATVQGGSACPPSLTPVQPHPSDAGQHGLHALVDWIKQHQHHKHDQRHEEDAAPTTLIGADHAPFAEGIRGETWDFNDPVTISRHKLT